ncbi:hypothetical protein AQUCO_02300073v1 [Aquilegia coerulea]|uniref:Uncharacterized protein n=1 Tax=Aquilegia coerulea TaxID=218851 RepID=A0A2G5DBX8_AQUCA|nr:hypothetical protein AQUCO_02300073v1 [Aquilegia coerulea]
MNPSFSLVFSIAWMNPSFSLGDEQQTCRSTIFIFLLYAAPMYRSIFFFYNFYTRNAASLPLYAAPMLIFKSLHVSDIFLLY